MNLLSLVINSIKALDIEDEIQLSYIHGFQLYRHDYLRNRPERWKGVFFRSLIFFKELKDSCIAKRQECIVSDYYIYSLTQNQFNALSSTIEVLERDGEKPLVELGNKIFDRNKNKVVNVVRTEFIFKEIVAAIIVFFVKSPLLYYKLLKKGNKIAVSKYFNVFCRAYLYLPYFLNNLDKIKPYYAITSNDHNVQNRALRLAAQCLGIKTVFIQHGAGAKFQPPLNFDFAFLNGRIALQSYGEKFKKSPCDISGAKIANTTVFLSGQNKAVNYVRKKYCSETELCLGIGISTLNEFKYVENFLDKIKQTKIKCIVRTHPSQSNEFITNLDKYIYNHDFVSHSNPDNNSLNDFFSKCSFIVAADTTLHLDAALAGIPSYYYEFSKKPLMKDYFDFEKTGLLTALPDNFVELEYDRLRELCIQSESRKSAIMNFSESYGTKWQYHEGKLVAKTLEKIYANQPLDGIYKRLNDSDGFKLIYGLH